MLAMRMRHCLKIVKMRIFFWSVFSCIRTEYRKITTRKNSVFRQFSCSASFPELLILEDSTSLQLIYFLTIITFCFVECIFSVNRDTMNQLSQSVN